MLRVVAEASEVSGSGVYQKFAAAHDGPSSVRAQAWLYVPSG